MQLMTYSLKNLSKKVGLRISVDKTKIQKIRNLEYDADIFLEGAPLEVVQNFTYLGSILSNVGDIEKDVKTRIGKAYSVFRQLQTVWGSKAISLTIIQFNCPFDSFVRMQYMESHHQNYKSPRCVPSELSS